MVQRQLPKVGELLELMQFKKPELDARTRRLDAALTIADLRAIAKRRTPKAAFDYTDGAAEGELSLDRAEIERTMTLSGVSSLAELEPRHVTQLTRLVPVGDSAVDAGL